MISMSLVDAKSMIDALTSDGDVCFSGVSIDSRTVSKGEMFVAIKGPNFDGHDYILDAKQRGAAAAMVSRELEIELPMIQVADTKHGLAMLAKGWRQSYQAPLIALTGSNGKTSVKEMIGAILAVEHRVLLTRGNYNNDLGVPLTLLRLSEEDEYAVVELGANHLGEISHLSRLATPDIALITNIGNAHLEGFGSQDNIAKGKAEIFEGLSENGVAILNRDDAYYEQLSDSAKQFRQISFGAHKNADIRLKNNTLRASVKGCQWQTEFDVLTSDDDIHVKLNLAGRHNVQNALAAIAVSVALNISTASMIAGLASMQVVAGRMQLKPGLGQWTVIDDTYNANPKSLEAALDVLSTVEGKKILVVGDMAELGESSSQLHENIGRLARASGVTELYAVGEQSERAIESFGLNGKHYESQLNLVNDLIASLHRDNYENECTILVKGSRSAQMDRIVDALVIDGANNGAPFLASAVS